MRPMRHAAALALLSALASAAANPLAPHTPPGWHVERSLQGDLNQDGQPDTVFVLRQQNPALIQANHSLGAPTLDSNPRRLGVLLSSPQGLQLAATSDELLPPKNDVNAPCLADPLAEEGDIEIPRPGHLKVHLGYFYSCGSWGVTRNTYHFRYQQNRFRLIGLEQHEFMRNTGQASERSTNFLSGKQKTTTGLTDFGSGRKNAQERWRTLPPQPPYYLDGPLPDLFRLSDSQ